MAATIRNQRGPVAGDTTFLLQDDVVLFDTTASDRNGFLPAAAGVPPGTIYEGAISAGANNAILTAVAGDNIGGAGTLTITPTLRAIGVQSDGVHTWTAVEGSFS